MLQNLKFISSGKLFAAVTIGSVVLFVYYVWLQVERLPITHALAYLSLYY